MKTRPRITAGSAVCLSALALQLLALSGCNTGQGQHNRQFKEQASARMSKLKAGTQWDMAQQQFLAGDLAKALKTIDTSIAINDAVPKSHMTKGRILIEMGRLEQAIISLDKAVELDPTLAEGHYYRGIVFERFTRYDDAEKCFRQATELDPTSPQYAVATAEMLVELDRLDEAKGVLSDGKKDFQHNAGVRQTLGHVAMMQGDVDAAVDLFTEACLLAPDEDPLLEDLARAQLGAGKFAEADYSLARLTSHPDNAKRRDLLHLRARCLIELDRPVDARSILLDLLAEDGGSTDVGAWIELGNVALVLGEDRRLREAANRLIAIAPDRSEGYFLLGLWHRKNGDSASAVASLGKAAERSGDQASAGILQGLLLQGMGRTNDAVKSYRLAAKADPADPRPGQLLSRLEGTGSAVTAVETD